MGIVPDQTHQRQHIRRTRHSRHLVPESQLQLRRCRKRTPGSGHTRNDPVASLTAHDHVQRGSQKRRVCNQQFVGVDFGGAVNNQAFGLFSAEQFLKRRKVRDRPDQMNDISGLKLRMQMRDDVLIPPFHARNDHPLMKKFREPADFNALTVRIAYDQVNPADLGPTA